MLTGSVWAGPIELVGTSGSSSVTARFENFNGRLVVRLIGSGFGESGGLVAVSFDTASAGALTPSAAVLGGSAVRYGPAGGANVGGEWGYGAAASGRTSGFRSMGEGYELAVQPNLDGGDLAGPCAAGVVDVGMFEYFPERGQSEGPEGMEEVLVAISGLTEYFDPATSISNIWFQFEDGTRVAGEPRGAVIPLPEAGALGLAAFSALAMRRRRPMKV